MKSYRRSLAGAGALLAVFLGSSAGAGSLPEALDVHREAVDRIEQEREGGAAARALSDIAMTAAVQCQELSAHEQAEDLFRRAIAEDATNAEAFRRYGDYLAFYRGKYAMSYYDRAAELLRKDPYGYPDEAKQALERSMAILHRDARDGVPVLRSRNLSVYVEPWVEYKRGSKRQMDLFEEYLNAACFFDATIAETEDGIAYFSGQVGPQEAGVKYFEGQAADAREGAEYFLGAARDAERGFGEWRTYITNMFWNNYGYIPADTEILDFDSEGNPVTIASRRADMEAEVADLEARSAQAGEDAAYFDDRAGAADGEAKTTKRKVAELEEEKSEQELNRERLKKELRRQSEELAYGVNVNIRSRGEALLRLFADRVEVFRSVFNPEDYDHQSDGDYTRYGGLIRPPVLSLAPRLDIAVEGEASWREAILENSHTGLRLAKEDTFEYGARGLVTYYFNYRSLRLSLEAFEQEIEVEGQSGDDRGNRQLAAIRYSVYPVSEEERFGQNRSTHWEAGIYRTERTFKGHEDYDVEWKPVQYFFVCEMLGMLKGRFDLVAKYVLNELDYSEGCKKGTYQTHEITVTPAWVPVYALYERTFVAGTELLRIGAPLKFSTGEGDFGSYGAGLKIEHRLVTRRRFAVQPVLGCDYTRYPDLDLDDWGVYAKLAINAGHVPFFR